MDAIELIKIELAKYPQITFKYDEKSIVVEAPEGGFEVGLVYDASDYEPYMVYFDGSHTHMNNLEAAVSRFMFGLSDKCRIVVEYWGDKPAKSVLETFEDGKWVAEYTGGGLKKPFWKKKTTKYLINNFSL